MPEIDQSRAFVPINIAILTVSDTRTVESDKSGDLLKARIEAHGHRVVARSIVKLSQIHISEPTTRYAIA